MPVCSLKKGALLCVAAPSSQTIPASCGLACCSITKSLYGGAAYRKALLRSFWHHGMPALLAERGGSGRTGRWTNLLRRPLYLLPCVTVQRRVVSARTAWRLTASPSLFVNALCQERRKKAPYSPFSFYRYFVSLYTPVRFFLTKHLPPLPLLPASRKASQHTVHLWFRGGLNR